MAHARCEPPSQTHISLYLESHPNQPQVQVRPSAFPLLPPRRTFLSGGDPQRLARALFHALYRPAPKKKACSSHPTNSLSLSRLSPVRVGAWQRAKGAPRVGGGIARRAGDAACAGAGRWQLLTRGSGTAEGALHQQRGTCTTLRAGGGACIALHCLGHRTPKGGALQRAWNGLKGRLLCPFLPSLVSGRSCSDCGLPPS